MLGPGQPRAPALALGAAVLLLVLEPIARRLRRLGSDGPAALRCGCGGVVATIAMSHRGGLHQGAAAGVRLLRVRVKGEG